MRAQSCLKWCLDLAWIHFEFSKIYNDKDCHFDVYNVLNDKGIISNCVNTAFLIGVLNLNKVIY